MRLLRLLTWALLLVAAQAHAQSADRLIGIWRGTLDFGPKLKGPLVISRSGRGYVATIGGRRAVSQARAGELRFAFDADGSFRARIDGNSIAGFWIQPARDAQSSGDPGSSMQAYATPVHLKPAGAHAWRGEVAPLRDRFTLWLSIFKAPDGVLTAAFRNPEMNSTGGASRFQVSLDGDAIRFTAKAGQTQIVRNARLLPGPQRIRIDWPDAGSMELTRRSGADAAAFFPRPPDSAPYVYRRPPQLADGWRTASAASVGIDEKVLEAAIRNIAAADPTARPPQLMHSILVAHRGKLVLEEYFYGFDRATPHDTRSAAKTFGSVLLGTAPARAAGVSPNSRIYDVMRSHGPFANPDPRKSQITVAHLLTHTSGLACNDNDDNSPGNESRMQSQRAEPNWWRYALDLPQQFAPGTRYAYCSANSNLVGAALTQATGTWIPELFRKTVAEPLQFGEWHWNLMPNGEGYLGGGAFLLPRDLLKVGQMYLDGGVWNGRRVVPAEWVRESTRPRVEITPATTGLSDEDFGNFYLRTQDALAWHLGSVKATGREYRTYGATGNGGQVLLVVPDADLAVVFTGGNYGQGVWLRWAQQIVGDKIIPAMHAAK